MRYIIGFCALSIATWSQPCFLWNIPANGSLQYTVEANDTIHVATIPLLYRHRLERWRIDCDSIHGDTLFLRQTLDHYTAYERTEHGDTATRSNPEWVGQSVTIAITRWGERVRTIGPAKKTPAMLPGSMFGPSFFLPLDSLCTRCMNEWLVEAVDTLVEYGYPPPVIQRLFLATIDSCTAGRPVVITYAETSRGFHQVREPDLDMVTVASLLGHGIIIVDGVLDVPAALSYSQQVKLHVRHGQSQYRKGFIHTSIDAILTGRHRIESTIER